MGFLYDVWNCVTKLYVTYCCHALVPVSHEQSLNGLNVVLRSPRRCLQNIKMPFKEAVTKVPHPSKLWNPFGFSILPRRFPRPRRGGKRQPIVPLKEWKIIRGDTVRHEWRH